ncbi:MAG: hypothetical protein JXB49_05470 [Bacteroidales bacterium]|nr:hypothetical protein [Bacteroidales bacterium]
MKYFFTTLRHINLKDFDCEYLELIPGVRISCNQKLKEKILTETFRDTIGILESKYFLDSTTFLYYEYEDNEDIFDGLSNLQILELILRWVDDILKNSWLYKDNCIVCDTAYLIGTNKEVFEASSLRLQYIHTRSKGELDSVVFTKKEMIEFIEFHHKIESYLYEKESGSLIFMLEKNFSRIGRALLFVKQAREARNLAYKISNYCAAFETLFTTDNMELSHKLSERTAYFLSNELNKLETYQTIKKAYITRSKLIHGASIDKSKISELPLISSNTDEILRKVLRKILNDKNLTILFDSKNTRIDEYFMKLVFE